MSETGKAGALSRWEDEGGALPCGPQEALAADCEKWDIPPLSDAEMIQLRIRVIALENMVLGLLSKASANQLAAIEEIAEFISPRADAKPHPLSSDNPAYPSWDDVDRSEIQVVGRVIWFGRAI